MATATNTERSEGMEGLPEAGRPDAIAVPIAVPEAPPLPLRRSLRARGWIATLALVAYVAGSVSWVAHERSALQGSMESLEHIADHEKAVALAEAALSGAVLDVQEISNAGQAQLAPPDEIVLYMEQCERFFATLERFDTQYTVLKRAIDRSYAALKAEPVRANWIDLRESLGRAAGELEIRRGSLAAERDQLTRDYHHGYDAVTTESLVLSLVGILVFGAVAAWFFTRLARDVARLEGHARRIVAGVRGEAMPADRDDELGRLIGAVNRMAVDLDEREKQLEVEGQRRSHHDKMLAVGALAAGVAHEVNNPLMAIAGLAAELEQGGDAALAARAREIGAQVQRAAQATRHLAEAAAPEAAAVDWIDLNALLRRVVQLMGYDKRYRHVVFDLQLDAGLPALQAPGDAVQQVLMQMLGLGCDALGRSAGPVRVGSGAAGGTVEVMLEFPTTLDFADPAVQRTLLLARAIIEPARGRLAFGQEDGPALRVKLALPS